MKANSCKSYQSPLLMVIDVLAELGRTMQEIQARQTAENQNLFEIETAHLEDFGENTRRAGAGANDNMRHPQIHYTHNA